MGSQAVDPGLPVAKAHVAFQTNTIDRSLAIWALSIPLNNSQTFLFKTHHLNWKPAVICLWAPLEMFTLCPSLSVRCTAAAAVRPLVLENPGERAVLFQLCLSYSSCTCPPPQPPPQHPPHLPPPSQENLFSNKVGLTQLDIYHWSEEGGGEEQWIFNVRSLK